MGNRHPILMKLGTQTKKNMPSLKITIPEVQTKFQDGRHVRNSSECYKMGNYNPILIQVGTQTKKNILSPKVTEAEVTDRFQVVHTC
jgi:hypothetical protein